MIANVNVNHCERKIGRSNYNQFRWIKISLSLIINYSSLHLQLLAVLGVVVSVLSLLYGSYVITMHVINPSYGLVGWNSLMAATLFLGGLILLAMSLIGEYLSRIIAEISHERQYIVGEIDV